MSIRLHLRMEQMYRGRRGRWEEADKRTGRNTDRTERAVVDCVRVCWLVLDVSVCVRARARAGVCVCVCVCV